MKKIKAAILADNVAFCPGEVTDYVYGCGRLRRLAELADLYPTRITSANLPAELPNLREVEAIFSCWGMLPLSAGELDRMPKLKALFYAGGSVGKFAGPLIGRGITVCSAVEANAIPVAEFCLAQILLSCKGAFRNSRECRRGPWDYVRMPIGRGVYGETIALVGIGAISRRLLDLLKPFNLRVIAVSNYLQKNPRQAEAMGIAELVSLEEAFAKAYVVSNHLPDRPDNRGLIRREHFASMRTGATFINTGRGAQVNEADLADVFRARPDLTALLDVQDPEPPPSGSPLYELENVQMTGHISGSANDEVRRMADFMIEDFQRYLRGEKLRHAVDPATFNGRA